jgi:hypothetical protein
MSLTEYMRWCVGAVDDGVESSEGVQGGVEPAQQARAGGDHDIDGRRGHGSIVLEQVGFAVIGCRVLGAFA